MRPALILPAIFVSVAAQAASLTVTVRDARGTVLRDAVVYAIPERKEPAAKQTATMDQKNRMFVPHVLPIQTGTAVRFPNSDDIRHQVYSFSSPKPFQLPLYRGTPAQPVVFDKAGVVSLGCSIHDRMSAFIVIVDTPYFQKSAVNGAAALTGLRPGKYTVRLWHSDMRAEPPAQIVTVSDDDRLALSFAVSTRGFHAGS
ncbi:MAG TPA: methylamine utilization protein [Thermoanaerobaculia bacterium]|nr:methylamine utilization protein [Thermoanaerobaculia bacterium]